MSFIKSSKFNWITCVKQNTWIFFFFLRNVAFECVKNNLIIHFEIFDHFLKKCVIIWYVVDNDFKNTIFQFVIFHDILRFFRQIFIIVFIFDEFEFQIFFYNFNFDLWKTLLQIYKIVYFWRINNSTSKIICYFSINYETKFVLYFAYVSSCDFW